MRIWIDLSNSPHPLLFGPISKSLENQGHEVLVTARDNAQTVQLAQERWPDAAVIGGPSPAGQLRKGGGIAGRVLALRAWAKQHDPDLALSHNSYAQIVASRSLGIRTVTAMDYEHQPVNHLAFRLAHRVLVPDVFPSHSARRQGARPSKTRRYTGFKEEIYLGDFEPSRKVLVEAGVEMPDGQTLVVARTPPTGATYHRFENPVFESFLSELARDESITCVLLARGVGQRDALREMFGDRFNIPERALDSRSLIHAADLFVGAGGTMSREAALIGTPTVSFYAGRRAAADVALERRGMLSFAASPSEVGPITKRPRSPRGQEELRARAELVTHAFLSAALDGHAS